MATIPGGGPATIINAGSNDVSGIAQSLALAISAGLTSGTITEVPAGTNPTTGIGAVAVTIPNSVTVNQPAVGVNIINAGGSVVGGSNQVVIGAGLPNQQVIADSENIVYFTSGGGGTIVTGDGTNLIGTPTIGGGLLNVQTGTGNDTINIFSGTATVAAGAGRNIINTGSSGTFSNVLFFNAGTDQVISTGGAGTDTVIGGNGAITITEFTKSLVYNGQGGLGTVTVNGGLGSETVFAGPGGGVIGGGAAGNNVLYGGTAAGASTLFGGGNNDVLFARNSSGTSFLIAGTGNETLTGAASTANNIFAAGSGGNTTIGGGSGNDTIYAGVPGTTGPFGGNIVIDGGLGNDLISFTNRGAGVTANVVINNFRTSTTGGENDRLQLLGYSTNQQAAITSAAATAGTVTLTDGTRITFGSVANLTSSNFA